LPQLFIKPKAAINGNVSQPKLLNRMEDWPVIADKERQDLPAVIFILMFLTFQRSLDGLTRRRK
jgi:hypothetical protein